jgi:Asp-tRNA(Asn)/Glu-tRNA(Gln) amidotransferase C subunit
MPPTAREPLGDEALHQLLSLARLDLTIERRATASPAVDMVIGLFDSLDEVEVGETPPAPAFDARWE